MKRKKRAITLIEIMIVILLIGLIGGALAFNMRGSMDEGKKFKTRQNISRVQDILTMAYTQSDAPMGEIKDHWQDFVQDSPLVKNSKNVIVDGWNEPLQVEIKDGEFIVTSRNMPDEGL